MNAEIAFYRNLHGLLLKEVESKTVAVAVRAPETPALNIINNELPTKPANLGARFDTISKMMQELNTLQSARVNKMMLVTKEQYDIYRTMLAKAAPMPAPNVHIGKCKPTFKVTREWVDPLTAVHNVELSMYCATHNFNDVGCIRVTQGELARNRNDLVGFVNAEMDRLKKIMTHGHRQLEKNKSMNEIIIYDAGEEITMKVNENKYDFPSQLDALLSSNL